MALIKNDIKVSDEMFSLATSFATNYFGMIPDEFKASMQTNPEAFMTQYRTLFFDFLNQNTNSIESTINYNNLNDEQLMNYLVSTTSSYCSFMSSSLGNNFNDTNYTETYLYIFNIFYEYVVDFLKVYGRTLDFDNNVINHITSEIVNSYFTNLPIEYKKSLLSSPSNYQNEYLKTCINVQNIVNNEFSLNKQNESSTPKLQ